MIKNNDTHTIKINPRRTVMKILFYDTKSYDKESFEATLKKYPGIQIDYIRSDLDPRTAALADGFDAVCAFVSSNVSEATLKILHEKRCPSGPAALRRIQQRGSGKGSCI